MPRLAFPILLAMVVAACGSSGAPVSTTTTIDIEMRDFTFSPDTLTLRAGDKVALRFKNVGKVEHEFMAGNEPTVGKGYVKDWLAGAQVEKSADHDMGHAGGGVRVPPNSTTTVTIIVPSQSGLFEFGCFISGHYEFGMRGRLVVDVIAPPSVPSGQGSGTQKPTASLAPTHAPLGDDDGEGH